MITGNKVPLVTSSEIIENVIIEISSKGLGMFLISDNYKKRFEGYGWNYLEINGHNEKQISKAFTKATKSSKPTIISCKTLIGFGSPNKAGLAGSHGSPLGEKEIELTRKKLHIYDKTGFLFIFLKNLYSK